jgi:hypothetical protein
VSAEFGSDRSRTLTFPARTNTLRWPKNLIGNFFDLKRRRLSRRRKMRTLVSVVLIAVCAWPVVSADSLTFVSGEANARASSLRSRGSKPPKPDLIVRGNEFEFDGNKIVNVYISNNGDVASHRCIVELTIRKIGTAAVGRKKTATIPGIQPGQFVKIPINASSILPANVNLSDTTFKVIADSTHLVSESNETNNEKWHNLN